MGSAQWEGNDLKTPNKRTLTYLHQGSHWGPQAMCDTILWAYGCIGTYTLAKQVSEGCLTCWKNNKPALTQRPAGCRNPRLWHFPSIQVDYTEMLRIGHLKYLLVAVNHLTLWVKAISFLGATAMNVNLDITRTHNPKVWSCRKYRLRQWESFHCQCL
jgi:hypothetical protein